jgi:hypothetical protein
VTVKGIASHAAATTLFARSKNPSIELIAKIGYAARGIVFMLIGLFAVFAAIGSRKHVVGNKGALVAVLAQPFGNAGRHRRRTALFRDMARPPGGC